jgi:hypothetical protein
MVEKSESKSKLEMAKDEVEGDKRLAENFPELGDEEMFEEEEEDDGIVEALETSLGIYIGAFLRSSEKGQTKAAQESATDKYEALLPLPSTSR